MPEASDMKIAVRMAARVYGAETAAHIFSKIAGKPVSERELGDMLADAFEFGTEMLPAIQQAVIGAKTTGGTKQ